TCGGSDLRSGILSVGYDDVTIKDLEIKHFCHGIHIKVDEDEGRGVNERIIIKDCEVHDNGCMEDPDDPTAGDEVETHGIKLHGAFDSTIENNDIHDNKGSGTSCEGGGNGIYLKGAQGKGANNNFIEDNTIHDNTKGGLFLKMAPEYNTITRNQLWGNGQGGIILRCKKSGHNTIEHNNASSNFGTGIWIGGPENTIKNNIVNNNRNNGPYTDDAVGGKGWGIKIGRYEAVNNILNSNTVCGNKFKGIVVSGDVGKDGKDGTTGSENTCDSTENYNDNGTSGCTYSCEGGEVKNEAPGNPTFADGCPTTGKIGSSCTFRANTTDPDGDEIYYLFDWGDGTNSTWLGPFESGKMAEAPHTWNETGTYTIKVKVKDTYGAESDWAEMEVSISKAKSDSDSEMSTATKAALISAAVLVPIAAAAAIFMIFRRRREDTEEEEEWEEEEGGL
ncbi:MAG: right-handed parallel beta-helix repeat-containing protein, partial [Thermoplasmata archaeon]|nr:right-handed parallel beta-helix repeat-containing protein [Thermoplasmata archaeon]